MNTQRIEISYKTIVFTLLLLVAGWTLLQIKEILFILIFAFIAASGLREPVNKLERLRIPRIFAIIILYVIIFFVLFLLLSFIVPMLIKQTTRLVQEILYFFSISILAPYLDISATRITDQLTSLGGNIYRATVSAISLLVNVFTFFVLTFYLLLERRHMRVFLKNFLGEEWKDRVVTILLQIEQRLGAWIRGEISLMIIIGLFSYIGLLFLNIEFALPIAILAGILEIVPIIGPIVSAIPAIIVALLVSPWLAVAVIVLYFIIQQLENHIIVPMVMKQAVGIPPMVTIIAILIGAKLAGVLGALLSIPLFICAQIVVKELLIARE